MSRAFIAKVQADTSLQDQLKVEGADPVAIAKAAGFVITTEDLKAHRQNLSDEELDLNILTNCKNIFLLM
ncbi:Nif11-like leader peptide family natural product precursor [Prochlorococcus marinus]|uniref:Nif11-like leader peptide family natural product precursor n=1 Tax=Prochlorococcus marinus TaxID=1219 RepID=UPI00094168EE|nr:Nif11-like leader peptide family natural product precursor [Prochlorococcus marinus]